VGVTILNPQKHGTYRPRSRRTVHNPQNFVSPGRPVGKVVGSWITDMAERRETILLCRGCQSRFNPKPYHYYREGRFEAQGACDGCKHHYGKVFLFVHEQYLGKSWDPGF